MDPQEMLNNFCFHVCAHRQKFGGEMIDHRQQFGVNFLLSWASSYGIGFQSW